MSKKRILRRPYTFPHRSRQAMTDYLAGNGGYHGGRPALAYNVKAHGVDLDADSMWGRFAGGFHEDTEHDPADPAVRLAFLQAYAENEEYLWEWGVEDARRMLTGADCYRTTCDGETYAVEWALKGLNGGWACPVKVTTPSRYTFDLGRLDEDDLRDLLEEREYDDGPYVVPFEAVRELYRIARHWEADLTPAAARGEIERAADWSLFVNIMEGEVERLAREYVDGHDREDVPEEARGAYDAYVAKLRAAAVTPRTLYVMGGEYRDRSTDDATAFKPFSIVSPSGDGDRPYVSPERGGSLWNLCKHHAHQYALSPDLQTATLERPGNPSENDVRAPGTVALTETQTAALRLMIDAGNLY